MWEAVKDNLLYCMTKIMSIQMFHRKTHPFPINDSGTTVITCQAFINYHKTYNVCINWCDECSPISGSLLHGGKCYMMNDKQPNL